jgi:hypothetical protein
MKLLLASVAALSVLGASAAHADEKWEADFRKCEITKFFSVGTDEGQAFEVGNGQISVSIGPDDIRDIESAGQWRVQDHSRGLRKCYAFRKVVFQSLRKPRAVVTRNQGIDTWLNLPACDTSNMNGFVVTLIRAIIPS